MLAALVAARPSRVRVLWRYQVRVAERLKPIAGTREGPGTCREDRPSNRSSQRITAPRRR